MVAPRGLHARGRTAATCRHLHAERRGSGPCTRRALSLGLRLQEVVFLNACPPRAGLWTLRWSVLAPRRPFQCWTVPRPWKRACPLRSPTTSGVRGAGAVVGHWLGMVGGHGSPALGACLPGIHSPLCPLPHPTPRHELPRVGSLSGQRPQHALQVHPAGGGRQAARARAFRAGVRPVCRLVSFCMGVAVGGWLEKLQDTIEEPCSTHLMGTQGVAATRKGSG